MKANIEKLRNGINPNHRKEGHFCAGVRVLGVLPGRAEPRELLAINWYRTSHRAYCVVWVHAHPYHGNGSGYAGGCGYDLHGSAMDAAIAAAGITLDAPYISGREAQEDAARAVAAALGATGVLVVRAEP